MNLISTLKEADSLRAKDRHEEARELLVQLAAEYPDNPVVQYRTACVYDYLGREREAIPYYLAAIEMICRTMICGRPTLAWAAPTAHWDYIPNQNKSCWKD